MASKKLMMAVEEYRGGEGGPAKRGKPHRAYGLKSFAQHVGDVALEDVTREMVLDYLATMMAEGCCETTVEKRRWVLRVFFSEASEGRTAERSNPAVDITLTDVLEQAPNVRKSRGTKRRARTEAIDEVSMREMMELARSAGDDSQLSLSHGIGSYLQIAESEGNRPHTLRGKRNQLRKFLRWAAENGITTVPQATPIVVTAYREWLASPAGGGGEAKSTWNHVTTIRAMMNKLSQYQLIDANPLAGFRFKRPARVPRDWIKTPEERTKVLAAVMDSWLYGPTLFCMLAGPRPSEMRFIKWDDVHLEEKYVAIVNRPDEGFIVKTGQQRTIPLCEDLCQYLSLRKLRNDCEGWVFRGPKNGQINERWFRPFGLRMERVDMKRVTPYVLRHTRATTWLHAGAAPKKVAEWLGTSMEMLELYYGHHMPNSYDEDCELDDGTQFAHTLAQQEPESEPGQAKVIQLREGVS